MRRVLFVIDGLSGGGAEKAVLTLAGDMARHGHGVAIASLRDEQAYPVPAGVRLLPCHDTRHARLRRIGEIARRARLFDALVRGQPPWDLVISNLPTTDRIVRASSLAETAWYCVHTLLASAHVDGFGPVRRARRLRRLRHVYGGRKLVAVSRGAAREIVERLGISPARLEVIPNPFDVEEVRRLAEEPCEMAGEDFLVHVGRIEPLKRHDRLLEAFARSAFSGRLLLIGSGSGARTRAVRDRISALGLGGRVELKGFLPNPYPYIRHARAVVSSSDYEGFSRVLVEALICGTPAVSTDCPGGPSDILTGPLAAGLADLTEEALAGAIDRVLDRPPRIDPEHYRPYAVEAVRQRYLELAD